MDANSVVIFLAVVLGISVGRDIEMRFDFCRGQPIGNKLAIIFSLILTILGFAWRILDPPNPQGVAFFIFVATSCFLIGTALGWFIEAVYSG